MVSTTKPAAELKTLGERVRAARHERGLSQSQLAGSELTKGFISQIESGLVRPSVRSLQILANRLGKPLDYFVGDEPLASAKRLMFHRLAAQAAVERRDWATARSEINAAYQEISDARERARLASILAAADLAEGDYEKVFTDVAGALQHLDPSEDAGEIAWLLFRRGSAYLQSGQLVAASESLEAARSVLDQHEIIDERLRPRVMVNLATSYRNLNRTAKAMATYESALTIATRTSEWQSIANSYMGIALSFYDSGDFEAAIINYRKALEVWQRLSLEELELSTQDAIATLLYENKQYAEARDLQTRCLLRAESVGSSRWVAICRFGLARLDIAEGHAASGLELARRAERELNDLGDVLNRATALSIVGAAQDELGEASASDEAYDLAIKLYESIDQLAFRSRAATDYAKRLRARGDIDKAFDMLELARGESSKKLD